MEIIRFQKIYPHNLIQDGLVSGGRFSVWRDIWRSVVLGSISNSLDIIRAILHVHAIPNYSSAFGREWGEVYCPLSALQLLAGSGGGPSSFLHFQLTLIILSRSRYGPTMHCSRSVLVYLRYRRWSLSTLQLLAGSGDWQ